MKSRSTKSVALLAAALLSMSVSSALARDRYHDGWHDAHHDRVAARRAGVVAGAIPYGVARSSQTSRNEQEFQRCLDHGQEYYYCDEQFRRDQYGDQRAARRAAVAVGATTRAVVRRNRWEDRHDDW